ncbi:MAG: hypothetical protein CM15mP122_1810 [Bacteroidota bacterium]|nr:MAG: hypothetical protein CM15mP122_1810 [Bacteroidota bacterium]
MDEEITVEEDPGMGLIINEFLASNDTLLCDPSGDYDDWVELYNDSNEAIDLGGMYFTDTIGDDDPYQIPDTDPSLTTVQPKGYILIWCDDDQEQGPLHVSNKLSKGGESIVLISQDNQTIIDSLSFTEQTTDVSMGRDPNNVNEFIFFENPTPGLPNN